MDSLCHGGSCLFASFSDDLEHANDTHDAPSKKKGSKKLIIPSLNAIKSGGEMQLF